MHSSTARRKTIDDFFRPLRKKATAQDGVDHSQEHDEKNAFELTARATAVPGLSLYPDFINPTEEHKILAFLNDSTRCIWRTDLSRRTMHFGGTYCIIPRTGDVPGQTKPESVQAPDMPQELHWLVQRFVDTGIYEDNKRPQFCIVNEYTGNHGISAHTENFQFGEPVVGLSLLSACSIRFHELAEPFDGSVRSGKAAKAQKTGRVVDVQLPPRSLLIMNGPSRWSWQHEIVRSAKARGPGWKRVSLTFRFKP
ncbi:MAG: hypothetical protein LQ338_005084 [Usnochroma carphineum]|nr:MAG: hypothetical protein LQ338_005084 [Usnochroma carphineum]